MTPLDVLLLVLAFFSARSAYRQADLWIDSGYELLLFFPMICLVGAVGALIGGAVQYAGNAEAEAVALIVAGLLNVLAILLNFRAAKILEDR